MAATKTRKLTYADFVFIPDDGLRHESIDGEHYVSPSPVPRHQRIVGRLYLLIGTYLQAHHIGELFVAPLDVKLSEHDIVEPDLLYVASARAGIVGDDNVQGAPDLVIEILSPSTRGRDLRLKRDRYEQQGVGEYWLVDPASDRITVLRRVGDAYVEAGAYCPGAAFESPLFPNLSIAVDGIMAR
ncbi:MAG TPA: Uma2 family endonuclease [Terriglobales bacterium]|nr:Uma2 family endonuclease [Terriglobales bacterium]